LLVSGDALWRASSLLLPVLRKSSFSSEQAKTLTKSPLPDSNIDLSAKGPWTALSEPYSASFTKE
jgi:hypothetical protein